MFVSVHSLVLMYQPFFNQTLVTTVDNDNFGLDSDDGTKMYPTGDPK